MKPDLTEYEQVPETAGVMLAETFEWDGGTVGLLHGTSGGAAITIGVDHRPLQEIITALEDGPVEVAYEPWQVLRRIPADNV